MTKKKKKLIRMTIVVVALLLIASIVLVVYGNRDSEVVQQYFDNYDEMEFNPFVANEERLDNSFLEYGKVLKKYASKNYPYYNGDPISVDVEGLINDSHKDTKDKIAALKDKYGVKNVADENLTAEGLKGKLEGTKLNEFLSQYKSIKAAELFFINEIEEFADGFKYTDKNDDSEKIVSADENKGALYVEGDPVKLEFEINVDQAGLYSLFIEYLMLEGRNTDMLVNFTIDGKYPFVEAANMSRYAGAVCDPSAHLCRRGYAAYEKLHCRGDRCLRGLRQPRLLLPRVHARDRRTAQPLYGAGVERDKISVERSIHMPNQLKFSIDVSIHIDDDNIGAAGEYTLLLDPRFTAEQINAVIEDIAGSAKIVLQEKVLSLIDTKAE